MGKKKTYTAEQIDTLVAYIVAEDAWYVIPVEALAPRAHLLFYPTGCNCGGPLRKVSRGLGLNENRAGESGLRSLVGLGSLASALNVGASAHARAAARLARISWIDALDVAA